jgi:RND family efflux transporter MFP subunit
MRRRVPPIAFTCNGCGRNDLAVQRRGVRTLLALLLISLAGACGKDGAGASARSRPPPLVAVARPAQRDVPVAVRAPVDLRPLVTVDVGAKTLGYLDAVLVDRGDRVARGQLVAVVRPSDLPDQLSSARAAAAQARASLDLARANKARANLLQPAGMISQAEMQQAEAALSAAEAQEASARAQVGALATRLGEMRITSPIDGVVSSRRVDPGSLVGPNNNAIILTIDQISVLRVFVTINESDVVKLRIGQTAQLELDGVPGRVFTGKVVRLAPALDPLARTMDAEVQLPNGEGDLRPGMYGRASIVTAVHENAIVAPVSAVQISNGKRIVFVLQGDKVQRREVQVGVDGENWLEVTSGLSAPEEIVVAGLEGLSDGASVRASRGVDPYSGPTVSSDGRDAGVSEAKRPAIPAHD